MRSLVLFAAVCEGLPATLDATIGHFRCAGGSAAAEAFRRIIVRVDGDLNRPPGISRWELARGEVIVRADASGEFALPRCDAGACGAWVLRVVPVEGAAEETSASQREALVASFYATGGAIDPPRDGAAPGEVRPMTSRWVIADGAEGLRLGVVLRDQRGGESVRMGRVVWR